MKKMRFLWMVLGLLLAGAASWAQNSVSDYGLQAESTPPVRPSEWTDFNLGLDAGSAIAGHWLSVDAAPLQIDTTTQVKANSIGFSFPFEDKVMRYFGLAGDGLVYFLENEIDTIGYKADWGVFDFASRFIKHAVYAMPAYGMSAYAGYSYSFTVSADEDTRIGYHADAGNGMLTIRYENLVLDDGMGASVRYSYDLVISQNGNISLHLWDSELPDLSQLMYGYGVDQFLFQFALKGSSAYSYAQNWNGGTDMNAAGIILNESRLLQTPLLSFIRPLGGACTAPEGVVASLETVGQRFDSFSGRITLDEGECDGLLVLFSTTDSFDGQPENERVYSTATFYWLPGDSVDGCPVVSVGDGKVNIFNRSEPPFIDGQKAPGIVLEPATEYYLIVFPYNDICVGGPVYATRPIVLPFSTASAAMEVEVSDIEANSVEFSISGNDGLDILVGCSRQQYYNYYYTLDFAQRAYEKGDTIFYSEEPVSDHNGPYLMEAVYSGPLQDGKLLVEDLEAGVPYYFYFWTETAENQYADMYSYAGVYTVPTLEEDASLVFNFANDAVPGLTEAQPDTVWPAGWSTSKEDARFLPGHPGLYVGDQTVLPDDLDAYRAAMVYLSRDGDSYTSWSGDMITPLINTQGSALTLTAKIQLATEMRGLVLDFSSLGENDTLSVWYKGESETEWTLADYLTDEELVYPEGVDYATVHFDVPAADEDRIQLRLMLWKMYGSDSRFCLNELVVDPALPCAFPMDIAVVDSLTTHRALAMAWQDQNVPSAASFLYAWREAGTEEWSDFTETKEPSCLITGLEPNTLYEVGVRAVSFGQDTSLFKTGEGATMLGMPYEQALTDMRELPRGYKIESDYYGGWKTTVQTPDNHTLLGATSSAYGSVPMMAFPPVYMEELAAPAEFAFQRRAFYQANSGGELRAIGDSSSAWILVYVSGDGEFAEDEVVDTIRLADCDVDWQPYSIDLSDWTGHLYVALAIQDTGAYEEFRAGCCFFAIDSIEARYTGDIPCLPVENIQQYDLTTRGVTLSWEGYSMEYGIYCTNDETGVADTVYTVENTYTFDNLEPGTMYTYFIQPFCEEGHRSPGQLSEEGFFTTVDVCAVPEDFTIISTTWRSVLFSAEAEGTKYAHIWKVEPSETPDIYMLLSTSDTIEIFVSDYETEYNIALRAICSAGDSSAWTDTLQFRTLTPVCNPPSNLDAVVTETTADLTWTGSDNHSYYWLYYRPASAEGFVDTIEVYYQNYTLGDLSPNTAYVWNLEAICDEVLISQPARAEFTTEGVANEGNALAGLRVGLQDRRIAIWNESGLWIDQVDVLSGDGRMLYSTDIMASDHVLLPALGYDGLVLVRVLSGKDVAVFKLVIVR